MDVYVDSIQHLPIADKMRLVELIWDDVASSPNGIPIPSWALDEARRRRDEMVANPEIGLTHKQMWDRIRKARDA